MRFVRRAGRRWRIAVVVLAVAVAMGGTAIWTNALGAGDRFDRLLARIEGFIDPPPNRATIPTVVVTQQPSPPAPVPYDEPAADIREIPRITPTPSPRPRVPVDITILGDLADHEAVFASQITNEMCAVAGTQMALAVMGLADNSEAFQNEIGGRIGEWESWEDSHNGDWGPAAIALALAAYGAPGYEIRAYDARADALRDAAIALSQTGKPVVLLPWWGAHTWVMTGYRADADPTYFADATVTGTYILDPWYPRVSSIWGPSDPPGTFQDGAEMERNFIGWSRPEGAYPDRDGKYVVVLPTTPV
ncbi:MAG TPA: hypothetical protein VEW45_05375 [Candidatus Dormibacteraeota bacterium]|nr:hypothetical protein [Candidatus Dormibacteraeota bacterium]